MKDLRFRILELFTQLRDIHYALGNIYEYQSYDRLINSIQSFNKNKPIYSSNDVKDLPKIGARSLNKIDEIAKTGTISVLDNMLSNRKICSRVKLSSILGVGPKVANKWVSQGIYTINDVKRKSKEGAIKLTKMQEIGVKYYDTLNKPITRKYINNYVSKISKNIKDIKHIKDIIIAGSYRRGKMLMNDIDLIIVYLSKDLSNDLSKDISDELIDKGLIKELIYITQNSIMYINKDGKKIDMRLVPYDSLGFYLLYFGSSAEFSRRIRRIASEKGLKLSEKGIKRGNKYILNKAHTEKEIFDALNIKYIPPTKR